MIETDELGRDFRRRSRLTLRIRSAHTSYPGDAATVAAAAHLQCCNCVLLPSTTQRLAGCLLRVTRGGIHVKQLAGCTQNPLHLPEVTNHEYEGDGSKARQS